MERMSLQLTNEIGLHARPAAVFVKLANTFVSAIQMRNLTTGSGLANAKSIVSLLALGVEHGHEVELTAEGADEVKAIAALAALIHANFTSYLAHAGGTPTN